MIPDIHPALVGPHALAVMKSKRQALIAYGIDPKSITMTQKKKRTVIVRHEEESSEIPQI